MSPCPHPYHVTSVRTPRSPRSPLTRFFFPHVLEIAFLEECHPFTCPYDNTRQRRQCARLTPGSRAHSKAASIMAITVKATVPITRSSLQLECKTSKSFPPGDHTPATQTPFREQDLMAHLPYPPTSFPLRIRRSHSGLAPRYIKSQETMS